MKNIWARASDADARFAIGARSATVVLRTTVRCNLLLLVYGHAKRQMQVHITKVIYVLKHLKKKQIRSFINRS